MGKSPCWLYSDMFYKMSEHIGFFLLEKAKAAEGFYVTPVVSSKVANYPAHLLKRSN